MVFFIILIFKTQTNNASITLHSFTNKIQVNRFLTFTAHLLSDSVKQSEELTHLQFIQFCFYIINTIKCDAISFSKCSLQKSSFFAKHR